MKTLSLVLMGVLMLGMFASSFVLAEDEVTDVPELTNSENTDQNVQDTLDEVANTDEFKTVNAKSVTIAEGWGINSDDTKAEIVQAIWLTKKSFELDPEKVKEIRETYKGDKDKIKEELKALSTEVDEKTFGQIMVGLGKDHEKYKLVGKEITSDKVSFYVLPIDSKYNVEEAASASVGTLDLEKNQYPNLALWSGTLVVDSQKWKISLASHTKLYKPEQQNKPGEGPKENQAKKGGFWEKFMFWKPQQKPEQKQGQDKNSDMPDSKDKKEKPLKNSDNQED